MRVGISGMGRIGLQLAKALTEARHPFVIIERNPDLAEEARTRQLHPNTFGVARM